MTRKTSPSTGTPETDVEELARRHGEALVVDVREPVEYVAGHIPGAVLIPLGELEGRLGELPRGRVVHVVCASGNRSLHAARMLIAAGIDAVSVAGGTSDWLSSGRRVVTGPTPS